MILGGSNTGVSIAMLKVAGERKCPSSPSARAGASLTNADCNAYTIHYAYDTTALANGTATTMVKSGAKSWFYLTADYAFGTQLQDAASKVVEANGGKNVGSVAHRWGHRTSRPSWCRHKDQARRCWVSPMPVSTPRTRSRLPTNSASPRR